MNTSYLNIAQRAASRKELALRTFEHLKAMDAPLLSLLMHSHRPQAFSTLCKTSEAFFLEAWLQHFAHVQIPARHAFVQTPDKNYVFFSGNPPFRETFYIFVFSDDPSEKIKSVLHTWQALDSLAHRVEKSTKEEHCVKWANLISQLLHDTSSLIQLFPKASPSSELQNRLTYQAQVQDNLLFFIRPVDLIRATLPLKDLILHSLQMMNLDIQKISLTISDKITDINVDAETFAKAFNEIVRNALSAVNDQAEKIHISAKWIANLSPFIGHDWIEVSVRDQGKGIMADFIEYVCDPFFTTRKFEGHSGFGLTNAKKIVEAHEGHLSISSEEKEGTTVTFYLPMLTPDDYE